MQSDVIQYHGSYRYSDRPTLERAIQRAHATIADDEAERSPAWMRCFVLEGTHLTVNLSVPASADQRFLAANVFLTLAHGALDGAVEATYGGKAVDLYVPGEDDDD